MTTAPSPSSTPGARPQAAGGGRTWKPTTAGILTLIAGILNLIAGLIVATVGTFMGGMAGFGAIFGAIGAPLIVLGIISIIGGIFAMQRRVWWLALVGAILAVPGTFVLGVLAIIFVAMGKKEFA